MNCTINCSNRNEINQLEEEYRMEASDINHHYRYNCRRQRQNSQRRIQNTIVLLLSLATFSCWSSVRAFAPQVVEPSWDRRRRGLAAANSRTTRRAAADDDFNMDELKRRIADDINPFHGMFPTVKPVQQQQHQQTPPTSPSNNKTILHIIAFDNAGVYSIEYPKGSGWNTVLAFESLEACTEFATRLRAQHFFDPEPQAIMMDTLNSFCDKMGVHMQIVPSGVHVIPPSQNVKMVGRHNRSLREQQNHIEYIFSMMDEPEEDGVMIAEISTEAFQ